MAAPIPTSTIRAAGAATVNAARTAGAAPLHSMITSTGSTCSASGAADTSTTASAPRSGGDRQPVRIRVAHRDPGAAGARDIGAQQTDRSGAGHQHPVPRLDVGLSGGPHRHRERLDQGGGVIGHLVRDGVRPMGRQHHVLGECAVDRRGGEELDERAEVVAPGQTLFAAPAGLLRLQRHPLPDPVLGNPDADGPDRAGRLVAQHQRLGDDEVGDPAVLVVVHVGTADADRGHLDQDLVRARLGNRDLLDLDRMRLDQPRPLLSAHALTLDARC